MDEGVMGRGVGSGSHGRVLMEDKVRKMASEGNTHEKKKMRSGSLMYYSPMLGNQRENN